MVLLKVVFKGVVIDVILVPAPTRLSITNMAPFMLISAVGVELIISVKAFATEFAFWVAFESTLINCTRRIIAVFLVFAKLRDSEKLMLVCKHFFVASTKIAFEESD